MLWLGQEGEKKENATQKEEDGKSVTVGSWKFALFLDFLTFSILLAGKFRNDFHLVWQRFEREKV